jgi:hypothetical protein
VATRRAGSIPGSRQPLDAEFVADLERIIERSREELAVLVEHARPAG